MAKRRLFRMGLLESLHLFYPAVCTLQSVTLTRDAYGQPAETWADEEDLTDLRGMLTPATEDKLRQYGLSVELTTHILALAGYYPTITPAMRVLVDEVAYTIRGVRHDAHGLQTHVGVSRAVASAGDV